MITNNDKSFFTKNLLAWDNDYNDRSMPWKGEKDPYRIWLSEIILQQTRVEQGTAYYQKFIQKFPRVKDLALAKDDLVFKMWEGLGYYSRCRNLLATARVIQHEMKGKFPSDYEDILQLKGVGSYTASAIASFAYNLPYAVIDGNVNRVLSRFFGIETPIDSSRGKMEFAELAQQLLPKTSAAVYNQAIMDFGAVVCKPQLPLCESCPLQKRCEAFKNNLQHLLPVKEKKLVKKNRWFYYLVLSRQNKLLVRKRSSKDVWQDLHEFYLLETPSMLNSRAVNKELLLHNGSVDPSMATISPAYRQQLTHQTIHARFIEMPLGFEPPAGTMLVSKNQLKKLAFPRLINQYLADKGWK